MKMETESGIKTAIICLTVHTTDWHEPETLEHWREQWAAVNVNTKFEEKGRCVYRPHRSYVRQGLDLIPTIHESQCPADGSKGIRTGERGTEPLD